MWYNNIVLMVMIPFHNNVLFHSRYSSTNRYFFNLQICIYLLVLSYLEHFTSLKIGNNDRRSLIYSLKNSEAISLKK